MATATLVTKTFTPLSGGATHVIPQTQSEHTKAGSVWNRLKSKIEGAVVNFAVKAPDNKLGRDANGNFWKIASANAYIKELEAVMEGGGGKNTPTSLVTNSDVERLAKENRDLKQKIVELEKAPKATNLSAEPSTAKPRVHLIEVATAVLGNEKVQHFAKTLSADQCMSVLARNLVMLHIECPGIDLSHAKSLCGEPPAKFGLYRIECAEAQKKVDALLASKGVTV